ncbi:MAG TPA: hypothetical protein VGG92_11960, partial [Caulobacteraceae bacterium]
GSILMICLSSIALRYKEPDLPRPYRAPLFPWLPALATLAQAALIAVVVVDDPASGLWSAIVIAAPLPIFLWVSRRRRRLNAAA